MIRELYKIIEDRKQNPTDGSYTNQLFEEGQDRMLQKIGEESTELIIAAYNQGDGRVVEETADLIYHLLVLLVSRNIAFEDIENELRGRRRPRRSD
jgi:phosphoribosyl-ATP pyrophosphohydrolase